MAGTPYPKRQMHRIAYTKLSKGAIAGKLNAVIGKGPASASQISDVLAGKQITIVTDKGPKLDYTFNSANQLTLSENGAAAVGAGYGVLTLGSVVLFTHLVRGTQRGYAVVIDQETNLATVFELWFNGYKDNREVQREIYYGYVEKGGEEAPQARHVVSNRAEGHGYYWKQDTGIETLEFYPSSAYSNFVELTRFGGELSFCGPSDYIKINDDLFIYTRTECEFSGIFTLHVMDLNTIEQVGLRLGFNEHDALEYYVFRGHGEWLGQLAHFEKFGDVKGAPLPPPSQDGKAPAKGARDLYRPFQTMPKMTRAQVRAAVAAKKPSIFVPGGQMAGNIAPSTNWLAGKSFTLRYDDAPAMEYRIDDAGTLNWRKEGGSNWTKTRYQAWESMPGVFLFGHLLEGEPNFDGHSIVVDFHQGLVTCFNGFVNTPYFANEAGARVLFGVIEMEGLTPPLYRRHAFTEELLGHAFSWNYQQNLTSMHLYSTPYSVSWVIFTDSDAGGLEWSGPARYVKIRDGLYFLYWLEEACNGHMGTILLNMHTMHDAGVTYHVDQDGLYIGQLGANARHVGRYDIKRFFQVPTSGKQV